LARREIHVKMQKVSDEEWQQKVNRMTGHPNADDMDNYKRNGTYRFFLVYGPDLRKVWNDWVYMLSYKLRTETCQPKYRWNLTENRLVR
jgi:hypothetical protein